MLTQEENELLTRVGPATPMGNLMRCFWQPVALAEELPAGGAPLPVRLLGEDLVLFRDEENRVGLLGRRCSHRGVDVSYGRLENGGLRCLYHGWLYDVTGRCLEQPAEPAGSDFCRKIRHRAYPCQELAGLIFAYLGAGEPPVLPRYEPLTVPAAQRSIDQIYVECNYLQSVEGGIDPSHVSFLHRTFRAPEALGRYLAASVRSADGTPPPSFLDATAEDLAPTLEVETTDYGLRMFNARTLGDGRTLLRANTYILPNVNVVAGGTAGDGYSQSWHVPLDDTHTCRYTVHFRRTGPIDEEARRKIIANEVGPDHRPFRNRDNRYLQDRQEMQTTTFAGLGQYIPTHDVVIVELQGDLQERPEEHLGYSDKVVVAGRRVLLEATRALEAGRLPPHVVRDPASDRLPRPIVLSDMVPAAEDWRTYAARRIEEEEATAARIFAG